jgi:Flp pilus assembly protein TadG
MKGTAHNRRRLRTGNGQAATELAVLLPMLCLLLFGSVDLGRYIKTVTELNNAAQVGVRVAQNTENAQGTPITGGDVYNAVQTAYPGATNIVVPVGTSTPVPSNSSFTVQVTANFGLITPFVRTLVNVHSATGSSTGQTLP